MVTTKADIGAEKVESRENFSFFLFSNKSGSLSDYTDWGCCMSIREKYDINFNIVSLSNKNYATHAIAIVYERYLPKKFRDKDFLVNYCSFFTEIGDGELFDLKFLGKGGLDKDLVPEDLEKLDLKSYKSYIKSDVYLFSFRMQTTHSLELNLASLSFIRFLHFSRYWFYVNHIMTLRENEDLADLNNLEILQLAAYGDNKSNSNDIHGLWHYKSPVVAENYSYYLEQDINVILKRITKGYRLNRSFCYFTHIYDIREIRKLFREGEYVSIYNKLINPVYSNVTVTGGVQIEADIENERGVYKVRPVEDRYLNSTPVEPNKII